MTPSEYQRRLREAMRRAEQEQRRAIDRYNQKVREVNRKNHDAVRKYNSEVERNQREFVRSYNSEVNRVNQAIRAHNSRVRSNQQRLNSLASQLKQLASRSTSTTTTYRTSTQSLQSAYASLERRFENEEIGQEYGRVVDLAERETANSLEVANRFEGAEPEDLETDDLEDSSLGEKLRAISPELDDRWRGAVFSLNPMNPDATRHFCTSAREIFSSVLEISAPDGHVFDTIPDADKTPQGNATRRSRIKYLLHQKGMIDTSLEDFVEANIANVLDLFQVFNDGTHGPAGRYDMNHLSAVRKRVEDGITFLAELIT